MDGRCQTCLPASDFKKPSHKSEGHRDLYLAANYQLLISYWFQRILKRTSIVKYCNPL